ncbi:MAG: hypothetical protein GTO45_02305 [Candidatus Aminicenantes bacterium]|nr:hypothetical protein [Candidatus Aminicenantes bacterium]NIM77555.1 hypothetical protein [Candidatus Aminicenantes bacterium]NIN16877.1 hypothetical protein [Candidatus Aminicenantes bacterium]NIN40765.1 hypothetical protein [Candidatus Aminicenantes bacterium]NIN83574.1 hypothetical protein [Candidatus Aminicenantes bacterium]
MTASELRTRVINEIEFVPDEQLVPLYVFIHYFRLGLEKEQEAGGEDIMEFAGCWKDMADEDFQEFLAEIEQRRHRPFYFRQHIGQSLIQRLDSLLP